MKNSKQKKIPFSQFKEQHGGLIGSGKATLSTATYEKLLQLNKEATETINSYQKTLQEHGYLSADDLSAYKSSIDLYEKTGQRLRDSRAEQGYLFDAENETNWQNTIASLNSNYNTAYTMYSHFDSPEAFTQALEDAKTRAEVLAKDTKAMELELDAFNAMADQYLTNRQQLLEYRINPGLQYISEHQADAIDLELSRLEWEYGFSGPDALKQMVAEKTLELTTTKRTQELDALSAVANPARQEYDPEFEMYCTYESTFFGSADTPLDLTYEFINGNSYIPELFVGTHNNYSHLTEDEKKLYNYYYRKHGKEKGEAYLDLLQDALNARAAGKRFDTLEGNTAAELLFAVEAGLDQFATGLTSLANWEGKYRATTEAQYLSDKVRKDLADDSIPWYNFKTGQWNDEILGSSLGQMTYDTISTTANMAPSILASVAIGLVSKPGGAVVGSVLMGASSGGNAYQQKLNMGFSQEQAASYGLLIGTSEIVLDSALGAAGDMVSGIAKPVLKSLGKIDEVLTSVSKTVGGKILKNAGKEAFEEGLQTILEPFLWEAVSGIDMSVDRQEVLYSALLSFISGGLFEGGSVATNTIINSDTAAQTGPMRQESYTPLTQEAALGSDQADPDGTVPSPTQGVEGDAAADPASGPQVNPQAAANGPAKPTIRQALEQAIENMQNRPMDPKTYNALFSYKNKLQHCNTTQKLLDQKRSTLKQQEASNASDAEIQRTQADIATLENMLAQQEHSLLQAEKDPTLQAVAEKTAGEIVENSRKNDVDISQTFDRIKAEGNIITDGSHIEKGKLKPNVTYQTGEHEYLYQTDGMGRICRAVVKQLKRKTPGKRKDHYRKTPGKLPGDEAGHLIADRFGGSRKLDNLVSQAKDVNRKEFGRLEDLWAAAIGQGKEVSVDIQVFYDGDGKRPVGFQIDYAIDGVVEKSRVFSNNEEVINDG